MIYTEFIETSLRDSKPPNTKMIEYIRNIDKKLNEANKIIINLENYRDITPFSLLLLARKINQIKKKYGEGKIEIETGYYLNSYLNHMCFFDMIGIKTEKYINDVPSNDTCVPLRRITRNDLSERKKFDELGAIEVISKDISKKLSDDKEVINGLTFLLREMIRNTFEHSETDEVYIAAQKWDSKDLMEIAIFDDGIGIPRTISKTIKKFNQKKQIWSDYDYISYALKPGVSAFSNVKFVTDPSERNSGYGLFMAKEICKKYGQGLLIVSGQSGVLESARRKQKKPRRYYISHIDGVGIQLRFSPSLVNNFNKVRAEIVKQGEKLHRDKFKSEARASKSSSSSWLRE